MDELKLVLDDFSNNCNEMDFVISELETNIKIFEAIQFKYFYHEDFLRTHITEFENILYKITDDLIANMNKLSSQNEKIFKNCVKLRELTEEHIIIGEKYIIVKKNCLIIN